MKKKKTPLHIQQGKFSATSFLALFLLLILVSTLFYHLSKLETQPLSYDESAVIRWSEEGVLALVNNVQTEDSHPPFFYLSQFILLKILPSSLSLTFQLRFISWLAGVFAIFFIYLIVRHLEDSETALITAFLLSTLPMFITIMRSGRMYCLAITLILASLYQLVKIETEGGTKKSSLLGFTMLAAALTHYYTLFVLPFLYLYCRDFTRRRYMVDIPAIILFWGFLPWFLLSSSSPISTHFSEKLTAWLAISGKSALVQGAQLFDFDLFATGIPGLFPLFLLISVFLFQLFHKKTSAFTSSLVVIQVSLLLVLSSELIKLLYGQYSLQPAQLVLLAPFLVMTFTLHLATIRDKKIRQAFYLCLCLIFPLAMFHFDAGQLASTDIRILTTELKEKRIIVPTKKQAIEVLLHSPTSKVIIAESSQSATGIEPFLFRLPDSRIISPLTPIPDNYCLELPGDPPFCYHNVTSREIHLDIPASPLFHHFTFFLDNNVTTLDKIQKISLTPNNQKIEIQAHPTFWITQVNYWLPLLMVLFLSTPFLLPGGEKIDTTTTKE